MKKYIFILLQDFQQLMCLTVKHNLWRKYLLEEAVSKIFGRMWI